MKTIHETMSSIRAALCEYIEATYHISSPTLIAARKSLLDEIGSIYQAPYIETTPRYVSGARYSEIAGLNPAVVAAYESLSSSSGGEKKLFDPPYTHQQSAIEKTLIDGNNLVVMTGTGSGKTESFLLPILGKLATEAASSPGSFSQSAVRALVLYPMNALVNDQLGRLRAMFGDARLVELFQDWSGRPVRFARYTSRTPYAGVRTANKDSTKLKPFNEFYAQIERLAADPELAGHVDALRLQMELKARGKWPAKPSISAWLGEKGGRWVDEQTGDFSRAVTRSDDSELLTRHEVQTAPPDILITNYSMLEYMMMRPVERAIFDRTAEWLARNPEEKFLVVLDEAHLYRGSAGAEVGLLLRRLRDRLNIPQERMQYICATASFNSSDDAPFFGAQLSGSPASTFVSVKGDLALEKVQCTGDRDDASILAAINLDLLYRAGSDAERIDVLSELFTSRGVAPGGPVEVALYEALRAYGPLGLLINSTMKEALPVESLAQAIFPEVEKVTAEKAVTVLLALGSFARAGTGSPPMLPSRIHAFFRGLPGLWVCLDPDCTHKQGKDDEGICGNMYAQPRRRCECGAVVLELFTCRNCGTAHARAYTDDVDSPTFTWLDPGEEMAFESGRVGALLPLDILLEPPVIEELAEPADLDLETGRINPPELGERTRTVYLRSNRAAQSVSEDDDAPAALEHRGLFTPCAVCNKTARFGRSYVQDHQTKGDQPFQAIVARQIQVQPPGQSRATPFAPLQGRKVLTFSDSRQVAARLAPNLQTYSLRDSLRPLIAYGYRRLQSVPLIESTVSLEDLCFAALLASRELNVRLRPEMKQGEAFSAEQTLERVITPGTTASENELLQLWMELRNDRPPESLLDNVVTTLQDRFLGFESLALGSLVERHKHTAGLQQLPPIPGIAESSEQKLGLARAWLRCWQSSGFWLNAMPPTWYRRPRAEGTSVKSHKGKFKSMERFLSRPEARRIFVRDWLPELLRTFTDELEDGARRLRGSELTLAFDGKWSLCERCKSVHRPIEGIKRCLDCGGDDVRLMDPESDQVFGARKGFYRRPVTDALRSPPSPPLALIAAEHTAQLNAPQNEDVFSKAERNELLFQDIQLGSWGGRSTAIDVLSSTTTMEVGIDIGALSGVALRNLPPARANYQQRAGRAGRRGNAVATVMAFGSADSHDDHYFREPDAMIRGPVVDPKLTLDNEDITRRHIRAYLLQRYHQERITVIDATKNHDLFSVLGTVRSFRDKNSILNQHDFESWLAENIETLRSRVDGWIPVELGDVTRSRLLDEMAEDCLQAITAAIAPVAGQDLETDSESIEDEEQPEVGEDRVNKQAFSDKLLDRLLYCGKLPRYAFPTDVATFHVFDRTNSSRLRPVMRYAPQQGLPIALTQYAPGKQVWVAGKCYTSGAIYSRYPDERYNAWENKKLYMECATCGFARTYELDEVDRGESTDCPACGGDESFGPAHYWMRPPGFAHPVDLEEVTTPDDLPESSYATRAKLTMGTPDSEGAWTRINGSARILSTRDHLLVSNTGPKREGYSYCVKCGRIEATTNPSPQLAAPHRKPYPDDDDKQVCDGTYTARRIVLGTDFITDVALISFRVQSPITLKPTLTATRIALRTISEALSKAAATMLEIEPGEILAEFRPALTQDGIDGREAEVFLYDTLPGGAGFAGQLVDRGQALLQGALALLSNCPANCDSSCYRCLRSFKNKFEHRYLDRHVGQELLNHILGSESARFNEDRVANSTEILFGDIKRQGWEGIKVSMLDEKVASPVIVVEKIDGSGLAVVLSTPLSDAVPSTPVEVNLRLKLCVLNELLIRQNLPAATQRVLAEINKK